MDEDLEFLLEGSRYVIYFYCPGGRDDPKSYWDSLPSNVRQSFLGTFQAFADHGQVPGKASGHPESWYHCDLPNNSHGFNLFKFKDDPRIRFYSVFFTTNGEHRVVLTFGYQDPKKGRQKDKSSPTGRATKKAEEATLTYILSMKAQ